MSAVAWNQLPEVRSPAVAPRPTCWPKDLQTPPAASSSQVWVMRAFSSGESVAALSRLRVQAATLPRQAHDRLPLAVAHAQGQGHRQDARVHQRLAVSNPLPEPAPVSF